METKTVGSGRRLIVGENEYLVDSGGFLLDTTTWDAAFAEGMAAEDGLPGGLTERHWDVIRFIRRYWAEVGSCPTVYTTCRALGLHVSGFRFLFPRGYQRGACRLAGISMRTAPPEEVDEGPELLLDRWVEMWNAYDLNHILLAVQKANVSDFYAEFTHSIDEFGLVLYFRKHKVS